MRLLLPLASKAWYPAVDFRAREIVDMYEAGIIDPVKVTKTALANAVSVAGTLITTNYAIIQTK